MRPHSLLHRLGAVLCGVLVLQLALLGPVAACTAATMAPSGAHAMGDMTGAVASDSDHDRTGGDERCELPLSGSRCATIACATVVLAPALVAPTTAAPPTTSAPIVAEPSVLESGSPTAPELPPPRA